MIPSKNLPLLLNLAYYGYNRALPKPGGSLNDFTPRVEFGKLITYCNQFIQYVANGLGYGDFNGMNANQMHSFMEDSKNGWISIGGEVAQQHANAGVMVLASRKMSDHGHVCLIVPGLIEKSHLWGESVPKCANVGKDVFFGKKVSYAFKAEEKPTYFALGGMI